MKRLPYLLTTILLVISNFAYAGGVPFTGSIDAQDVEYTDTNSIGATNVGSALDALALRYNTSTGISNEAYDPTSWDSITALGASKNALRDEIVKIYASIANSMDAAQPHDADLDVWATVDPRSPVFTGSSITSGVAGSQQGALILNSNTHAVYNFTLLPGTMTEGVSWRLPGAMPAGTDYLLNIDVTTGQMDYTDPATFAAAGHTHDYSSVFEAKDTTILKSGTTLGTFTGTTIPDSQTISQALQALETAIEGIEVGDPVITGTLAAVEDTSGVTPSQYWGSDALGAMGYHDLPVGGDLVSDTTPQLGGDLDVNGKEIQSAGNIVFQLGDNAGTNKLSIQDSDGNEIWQVNSNGESGVATAAPHLVLRDSDNLGADEECARIEANATTTTDGSEDGYISISPMRNGSPTEVARFDPDLAADLAYSGVVRTVTAGENLAFGDLVYLTTSTGVIVNKADADASTSVGDLFICLGTINDGSSGLVLVEGFIRHDTWNWTSPGLALYVSTSVGTAQEAAPSGSGDQVQKIGYSWSADIIHFKPSIDITEVP
jgi:hypothetical protein